MSGPGYRTLVGRSVRRWWPSSERWEDGTDWVSLGDGPGKILWYVQTYRDRLKLQPSLQRLRRFYPTDELLVVSDGAGDSAIEETVRPFNARFQLRPRLFTVEHGGLVVQRMLDAFLETHASVLIKIDPDSDVRRCFSRLPSASERAIFGTVQQTGPRTNSLTSIQGGCIVVPRSAAEAIAGSRLLESERLKPPACEWAVDADGRARVAAGLTSYDWTLGWACRELAIPCRDHPEVFSRYAPGLMDTLTVGDAAVAHPRFEWAQLRQRGFFLAGLRAKLTGALS